MWPALCLIGTLAAGSAWAQQAPAQSDPASGTKPIKGAAPVKDGAAPGAKPVMAPAKQAAKPAASDPSAKPATAPKAPSKPKAASKPAPKPKAKPAPAKRAKKAKPKAPPKPAAAPGTDASKAAPATVAPAPRHPAARPLPDRREAEARYREGVELEQRGDMKAALKAYHQAGESGDAQAQKKLGDLYGTGNEVVERDYETSLRWYERARGQGVEPRKPHTYPGVRR